MKSFITSVIRNEITTDINQDTLASNNVVKDDIAFAPDTAVNYDEINDEDIYATATELTENSTKSMQKVTETTNISSGINAENSTDNYAEATGYVDEVTVEHNEIAVSNDVTAAAESINSALQTLETINNDEEAEAIANEELENSDEETTENHGDDAEATEEITEIHSYYSENYYDEDDDYMFVSEGYNDEDEEYVVNIDAVDEDFYAADTHKDDEDDDERFVKFGGNAVKSSATTVTGGNVAKSMHKQYRQHKRNVQPKIICYTDLKQLLTDYAKLHAVD